MDFLNDFLYWLATSGVPVLAAFVFGVFGIVGLLIWRTIAPKLEDARLKSEVDAAQSARAIAELDARRALAQIKNLEEEVSELNDTIRSLSNELEDAQDRERHTKRSEEAYAENLELLQSSIEETILAAQPAGGYASAEVQSAARAMAERLIREVEKTVHAKLTSQNYASSKKRLEAAFDFAEKQGVGFSVERRDQSLADLRAAFEDAVKREFQREEQARMRAQIREEQRLEMERQRELKRLEAQQKAIEEALERELSRTHDEHSKEVEALRAQLLEAQSRTERAISQAQLTKAGNVYVISNIGSFGEDVFKIGMTRRLEPYDRIKELGDASVPFPFDVHMMIACEDAPSLENALHRELHRQRVNRVNFRKEYFKVELARIAQIVEENHGKVEYAIEPEASQYRESLTMTDEEEDYVASVLEPLGADEVE